MKKVLVLGGNRLFGKELVERLVTDGHDVTILTRGQSENPFGERVKHIKVDRTNSEQFAAAVAGQTYDIVYDNICYLPSEAKAFCDIFNGKIGKLVFTSTLSTYEANGVGHKEEDFDPYTYEINLNREAYTYGEGKRQCEAVFFKYAQFPVVAVRFPIVMDANDYTRRLHFHIEHVLQEKPMGFYNMDAKTCFILASEAGEFLKFAGIEQIEGPVNACANGEISLQDLIAIIEEKTGKHARIAIGGDDESRSPYAFPNTWYMKNDKATAAGFSFTNLQDWLSPLIEEIVNEVKA